MDPITKRLAEILGLPKHAIKAVLVLRTGELPLLRVTSRVFHLPASGNGITHETLSYDLVPRNPPPELDFKTFSIVGATGLTSEPNKWEAKKAISEALIEPTLGATQVPPDIHAPGEPD